MLRISLPLVAVLAILLLSPLPASAQLITNAVRGGSSTDDPPQVSRPLQPGALAMVDRVHVYFTDMPQFLRGLDYVRPANDDRTIADYTLDVTLSAPATLYLFIDNRVGDNTNTNPPTLTTNMTWVARDGFTSLNQQFGIDEGNDGAVNQFFTIYSRTVPAGTIRLFEQNAGTLNMYGVAAAPIPEPSTLVLAGLGGLGFALRLRRRVKPAPVE
jgi:hypothetical protein